MATFVNGDLYEKLDGKLYEIKRQIRQKEGYPFDPERLALSLQAIIEGRFEAVNVHQVPSAKHYTLFSDDEAVAWIMKRAQKLEKEAQQFVSGVRSKARAKGVAYEVKIFAEVQPGCTFKGDIPLMGPTWENFKYLQDWDFPDPQTERCLVWWIPIPLASSTNKNASEQAALIVKIKTPAWCSVSFGSVNHVAGMALAHFNATGKDPFNGLWVCTDTCSPDGLRLKLCWNRGRLNCYGWAWDEDRSSDLAVFVVGVVKALGH